MYELAKKYYNKYGNLEVPALFKTDDGVINNPNGKYNLGTWVRNRRNANLTDEERTLLSDIGMRFETRKKSTIEWEDMFLIAAVYYFHYGDLDVPYDFKTDDGKVRNFNGKYSLGAWVQTQRQICNPSSEKGMLLSKIGMHFKKSEVISWKDMYEEAVKYFIENGNLAVPSNYITSNGYNLGTWVQRQKRTCDPYSEHGKLLSKIGMDITNNSFLDDSWMEKFNLAAAYYEKYHNLEIPSSFITDDGVTYNENGKVKLGMWLAKQRERCNPYSERGNMLLSKGMRFETKDVKAIPFENGLKLLTAYCNEYKNINVPYDFVTSDGVNSDKKGVRLGRWVFYQTRKNSPESLRGQILMNMGVILCYNAALYGSESSNCCTTSEIEWLKMFSEAAIFYKEFGHLRVPQSKKRLFSWLSNQKEFYRTNSLSIERVLLLEAIGIVWNPRLEVACVNLGINYGKNIEVLRHMTYNDFKLRLAFIDYLNKKGYDVVNDGSEVNIINYDINFVDPDGNLHEIFSMSNVDLEAMYGDSFSDFFENYNAKQKRISF